MCLWRVTIPLANYNCIPQYIALGKEALRTSNDWGSLLPWQGSEFLTECCYYSASKLISTSTCWGMSTLTSSQGTCFALVTKYPQLQCAWLPRWWSHSRAEIHMDPSKGRESLQRSPLSLSLDPTNPTSTNAAASDFQAQLFLTPLI